MDVQNRVEVWGGYVRESSLVYCQKVHMKEDPIRYVKRTINERHKIMFMSPYFRTNKLEHTLDLLSSGNAAVPRIDAILNCRRSCGSWNVFHGYLTI